MPRSEGKKSTLQTRGCHKFTPSHSPVPAAAKAPAPCRQLHFISKIFYGKESTTNGMFFKFTRIRPLRTVKFLTRTADCVRRKPQMKNQNNPRAAEMSGNNKPCFLAQKTKPLPRYKLANLLLFWYYRYGAATAVRRTRGRQHFQSGGAIKKCRKATLLFCKTALSRKEVKQKCIRFCWH